MRIGILGGSFNPVHNGHLRVAVEALELMGLSRVDLVPAAQPPHKPGSGIMAFDWRFRLLEAAVEEHPKLAVNPLEGRRQGPSYTVETLQEYLTGSPEAELFFLLGCNDFLTLPKWRQWERLFELTNFVVVGRHGREKEALARFLEDNWPAGRLERPSETVWMVDSLSRVSYLAIPRLDISGTLVRQKLRESRSVDYLVPEGVARLLREYSAGLSA